MIEKIMLHDDFKSHWFGMGDFEIELTQSKKIVKVVYVSEPPFGDSYHQLFIDDEEFKGFVWGCNFLFPFGQEYLICSWMEKLFDRKTILINLTTLTYNILPDYYDRFEQNGDAIVFKNSSTSEMKKINLDKLKEKLLNT